MFGELLLLTTEGASPEQSKASIHLSMISTPEEIQACFAYSHGTEMISCKRLPFAHSVVALLHQAMLQHMISSTAPAPCVCISWIVFPRFHLPVYHGQFFLACRAQFQLEQRMFVFWLSMHVLGPHQLECTFIFRSWFPRFFSHLGFVGFSSSSFHPLVLASHPFVTVCFHGHVVHRIRRPFAVEFHRNKSKRTERVQGQVHNQPADAPLHEHLHLPSSPGYEGEGEMCIWSKRVHLHRGSPWDDQTEWDMQFNVRTNGKWVGQELHWIVQAFRDTWNTRWACRFLRLTERWEDPMGFVSPSPFSICLFSVRDPMLIFNPRNPRFLAHNHDSNVC